MGLLACPVQGGLECPLGQEVQAIRINMPCIKAAAQHPHRKLSFFSKQKPPSLSLSLWCVWCWGNKDILPWVAWSRWPSAQCEWREIYESNKLSTRLSKRSRDHRPCTTEPSLSGTINKASDWCCSSLQPSSFKITLPRDCAVLSFPQEVLLPRGQERHSPYGQQPISTQTLFLRKLKQDEIHWHSPIKDNDLQTYNGL